MKEIAVELRSLSNLVMRAVEQRAREHSGDLITGMNGWIICYILQSADCEVYQRELEEAFSITRSTASRIVNLMQKKGIVERRTAEHDARMLKIALSDKAMALAHRMDSESEQVGRMLVRDFAPAEIDQLNHYIERMKQNMRDED
ncbi:MAG: MarR family winged helix-turn-helix transcriptional regulator [Christensenellales bacterium]|jgi:DNA-binding MarR family transcriptional regulator